MTRLQPLPPPMNVENCGQRRRFGPKPKSVRAGDLSHSSSRLLECRRRVQFAISAVCSCATRSSRRRRAQLRAQVACQLENTQPTNSISINADGGRLTKRQVAMALAATRRLSKRRARARSRRGDKVCTRRSLEARAGGEPAGNLVFCLLPRRAHFLADVG